MVDIFDATERWIHNYARRLKQKERRQALELFTLNTRLFPGSFSAWNGLGEFSFELARWAPALECYRRAVELDPVNQRALRMIERLEAKLRKN